MINLNELQEELQPANGEMPGNTIAVLFFILVFLSLAIYGTSLSYPFIGWDDYAFFLDDPAIQSINLDNLKTIFFEPRLSVWYPVTRMSHAIDLYLFGANAALSRLINIGIHVSNSLIVFLISLFCLKHSKLPYSNWQFFMAAVFASIIFCIHPQHVEAVIWVAQRNELLSALFFFCAIYLYLRYIFSNNKWLLFAVVLIGIVSMLAKPVSVTLPLILILIDVIFFILYPNNNKYLAVLIASIKRHSLLLLFGVLIGLITIHSHDLVDSLLLDKYYSWPLRLELSLYNFLLILACLVYPLNLSPAKDIPTYIDGGYITFFVLLTIFSSVIFFLAKKNIKTKLSLCFLTIVFLIHFPVSGILMFGTYASGDRYAYVSTMPLYVASAFCLLIAIKKYRARIIFAAALITIFFLSTLAHLQTKIWKNDFSLWDHVVRHYPRNAMSLYYLGDQYKKRGMYIEAIHYMEAAADLGPVFRGYPTFIGLADIAEMYKTIGMPEKAIDAYKRVLRYYGENATVYAAMGVLEIVIGEKQEAFADFDKAYLLDRSIKKTLDTQLPYFDGVHKDQLAEWLNQTDK